MAASPRPGAPPLPRSRGIAPSATPHQRRTRALAAVEARLAADPGAVDALFDRAQLLVALGRGGGGAAGLPRPAGP